MKIMRAKRESRKKEQGETGAPDAETNVMQEIMQNTKYLLDEENITNSTSERFTG